MNAQRNIVKTYTKSKLSEQKSAFVYWQSQSPEQRLAALEQIRNEYHAWKYDPHPRFQRVPSVIMQENRTGCTFHR